MTPTTYGHHLRRARLQRGLTQERFAELAGVSKRTVEYWEHGKRLPPSSGSRTREALLAWAQALPKTQTP